MRERIIGSKEKEKMFLDFLQRRGLNLSFLLISLTKFINPAPTYLRVQ